MERPSPPIHLSCLTASAAPIICVIARMPHPSRWSCILKWDVKARAVEEGAWTTLRFKWRVCRLSPDGRFFYYNAKGPLKGPFSAYYGGAMAISRLPWLAALTDLAPASYAGGGPSRHALSREDQERLWDLFRKEPSYFQERHWPRYLGHRWARVSSTKAYGPQVIPWWGRRRARRVAIAEVPGRGLRLVAVSDRGRLNDSANEVVRYYLESGEGEERTVREVEGVTWAHPTEEGGIAVATVDGRVRHLRPRGEGDATAKLRVDQDHDLSRLRARPGPAPRRAVVPLGGSRRD